MFFAANCKSCAWTWGVRGKKNEEAERRDNKLVIANHSNCTRTASSEVKLVTTARMEETWRVRVCQGNHNTKSQIWFPENSQSSQYISTGLIFFRKFVIFEASDRPGLDSNGFQKNIVTLQLCSINKFQVHIVRGQHAVERWTGREIDICVKSFSLVIGQIVYPCLICTSLCACIYLRGEKLRHLST